jgi:hypothetical protein
MPYLNTDDGFPEHPKVDALSDGAFRLHVAGMHYAAKNLSDGTVPRGRVDRLKPGYKPLQLKELLRGGLWHEGGQGCDTEHCPPGTADVFVIHDYLQWNKSREWWESERARKAKNKADWIARNKRGLRAVPDQ